MYRVIAASKKKIKNLPLTRKIQKLTVEIVFKGEDVWDLSRSLDDTQIISNSD